MPAIDYEDDGYPKSLSNTWETMNANKNDIEARNEEYARWTVPSICPEDASGDQNPRQGNVAIGARLVNSLANRVVDVMFPSDRPFFSLPMTPKSERELVKEHGGDKEAAGKEMLVIRQMTEGVVNDAMRIMDLTSYRPVAVEAVKHAIITGGCILRRHDDNLRSVYGIKNYACMRDTRGVLTAAILRDSKTFSSLTKEHQDMLETIAPGKYKQDAPITLYTYFERTSENTWITCQGLDDQVLDGSKDTHDNENLPIIDITWSLQSGDNYPRGLVEENQVLFGNIDVTSLAIIDMFGIAADTKFLVNPASMLDVDELNSAPRGSYHAGIPGDVEAVGFKHRAEMEVLINQVQSWERQLAQVFLLMSAVTRDAERVTAEEIRGQARELESAFGGLYSKLALVWQKKEAMYVVNQLRLEDDALADVDVVVTTGLESLSREGQLDALRLAIADLQMMDTVPEDLRAAIDVRSFAEFVFTNRGVNFGQFVKSKDVIAAEQKAAQEREQQMMQQQSQMDAASKAAAAATK